MVNLFTQCHWLIARRASRRAAWAVWLLLLLLNPVRGSAQTPAEATAPTTPTAAATARTTSSTLAPTSPTLAPTPAPTPAAPAAGTVLKPASIFGLKLDPRQSQIGDLINLELEIRDPSIRPDQIDTITFNPDPQQWHVEQQWRRDWQKQDAGKPNPWHAALRPFDTGTLTLPATTVLYRTADGRQLQAQTTTATLKVASIRPPEAELTLLGLRDPAAVPIDRSWIGWLLLWLVVAGLAVAGAIYLWRRWRRAMKNEPAEPPLPPGLWALRELNRRSRLPVSQNGPAKAIFSHASEVIRLYLERRYAIAAIDMTSYECLQALESLRLSGEVMRWLREFFGECDLIKFTTYEPSRERWQTIWHDARLIVKMTTPAEELGLDGAEERDFKREVAV